MRSKLVRSGLRFSCTYAILSMPCVFGYAAEPDVAALRECTQIVDNMDRLACFDNAMGTQQVTGSRAEEPATETDAGREIETDHYVPLNDEVGQETLDRRDDIDSREPEIRGRVVRCETDVYGKYYFYFDNGQVWKQKDGRRLAFAECDFEVTISKDFFGYRMQALGEQRKIRISRVQ